MEEAVLPGSHHLIEIRKGLFATTSVALLAADVALAQTDAPEPLPEPPAATTIPLDETQGGPEGAAIDVLEADSDSSTSAGTAPAASEDRETAAQQPENTVLPEATTTGTAPEQSGTPPLDPTVVAPPLREQVATCYAGDAEAASGEQVTLSFRLDSAGLLLGIPEHVGDGTQSAAQRRLFLDAVVALEECAPYSVSGSETTYEAVFTGAEVASIDILTAAPLAAEPEVLGTARVDTSVYASEEIEAALELSRSERREIQNRLRLVAHDPGGADGVFGPNTRTAISSWQAEQGYPVSGFLNDLQLTALREQSQVDYEAFERSQPEPRKKRKSERVRVCKRGVFGVLYDCRFVWR